MSEPDVTKNEQESRYEARIDGQLAGFLQYRSAGDAIELPHTEVDPQFGGQGVGSALVRYGLDEIRAQGEHKIIPTCPFVKGWLDKHPDYQDLEAGQA
ncbi:hypothetical protein SAMN05443377_11019 [Propionibacterium cyclohexanicum]|uniref:Uncharacterized protein n=1 Tax=Propionibacterium cyclohexanicum TaxID=64702 RepID=A0A1H9S0A0_9ACTN|nr:GNAT family N-acetyltransferase [Propionibacterium cyclohexanicum]SER77559.1 hypothetical protein SAMN05443377_11019 [Propionibacterium cyclohexanicum]